VKALFWLSFVQGHNCEASHWGLERLCAGSRGPCSWGLGSWRFPGAVARTLTCAERQRWLSHRVAKTAQKLDQAHQELSTAIVVSSRFRASDSLWFGWCERQA